jgi:hypothetical protein
LGWLLLCALVPVLLAPVCEGSGPDTSIQLTLNGIPSDEGAILVVPPSGFTVDVEFGDPRRVLPETLYLVIGSQQTGTPTIDLVPEIVAADSSGVVAMIPAETPLETGTHVVVAGVETASGRTVVAALLFAVREHALGPPLANGQWVQLDFSRDRDGDGLADFRADLPAFGLGSAADPASSAIVHDWVIGEVVARTQAFFDETNPSGLPGGDAADVVVSDLPAPAGPSTRICVGGEDPTGGDSIGNVLYDARNGNPSDVACDDFLPSGVFPRGMLVYAFEASFQNVFAPLLAFPVGEHPLDASVLGPGYDAGDPAQLARFETISAGVEGFAQALASITAHEVGHALGMVAPGEPGEGLFGGFTGPEFTHNLTPEGATPSENLLMNAGPSFSFARLAGLDGETPPRIRELNWAYLQGRIVLDPAVTGIYPAPSVQGFGPSTISRSGPLAVTVTVLGQRFLPTATVRLLGPLDFNLLIPTLVDGTELTGMAVSSFLEEGTYAVEVTNPDGQVAVLPGAVSVTP